MLLRGRLRTAQRITAAALLLLLLGGCTSAHWYSIKKRTLLHWRGANVTVGYVQTTALSSFTPGSIAAGNGLGGAGAAWATDRAPSRAAPAGLERPTTLLSDPLLLAIETGIAPPIALALLVVFAWCRVRRREPTTAAALAVGAALSVMPGHTFAPLNGWAMIVLVGLCLPSCGVPGERQSASPQLLPLACAGLACLLALLATVRTAPPQDLRGSTLPSTEWQAARVAPDPEANYAEAAQWFGLRWAALHGSHTAPPGRLVAERDEYAAFCEDYAAQLVASGDRDASDAYRALAEQLMSLDMSDRPTVHVDDGTIRPNAY